MAHPLQNHPGLRGTPDLPVRPSLRHLPLDRRWSGALPKAVLSLVLVGGLLLVFTARMDPGPVTMLRENGGDIGAVLEEINSVLLAFWAVGVAAGIGCLVLAAVMAVRAIRRPLREQRRYYALRGLTGLSDRQRRAMRVMGHWMHRAGGWVWTMEIHPSAEGMTAQQRASFRTFVPEPAETDRDGLASDWDILNAQDARETIDHHLREGVHSWGFAQTVGSGMAAVDRLAALGDLPISRILELAVARDGRPAQLLWGWDLIRIAVLVRYSVTCGYLTAEEGLDRLEEITDHVAALFPTEEELIENCELGFAVWAGPEQRAQLRARREDSATYLAGSWPETLGPWPVPSGRPLPPAMAEGFAAPPRDPEALPD